MNEGQKFKLRNELVVTKEVALCRGLFGLDTLKIPVGTRVRITSYTRNNMDHMYDGYRMKVLPLEGKRTKVFELNFSVTNEHFELAEKT